jgi:hypothetical protein
MEGEIVTLRGQSEYRFSNRLEFITGTFDRDDRDGSVAFWVQEWKPRFQITTLRLRAGDGFVTAAGFRVRVLELNAHNIRPYLTLEVLPPRMESLFPEQAATQSSSYPTMM